MSIQILQYEFLGPINLGEWGPPMEKVVYLILSRNKDSYNIIYAGDCDKTEDPTFFSNNPSFNCWVEKSGSDKSIYLAILPLFNSESYVRKNILDKILLRYHPICNSENHEETLDSKPSPLNKPNGKNSDVEKISCPCCGNNMKVQKILKNSTIIRCNECGLSDSRINS